MNREIKFRAWDKENKEMVRVLSVYQSDSGISSIQTLSVSPQKVEVKAGNQFKLMQFTGLKDKNGLTEIYEGDIIDREGNIIGNQYENSNLLQEKTNLIIQGFGTKDWCPTYQKALDRGCQNSE